MSTSRMRRLESRLRALFPRILPLVIVTVCFAIWAHPAVNAQSPQRPRGITPVGGPGAQTPGDPSLAPPLIPASGTWAALAAGHTPGVAITNCLLLTDGRVMCQVYGSRVWVALTPDNTGSYANGTWATLGSTQVGYAPLYYASAVLPDGRVIIEGGEYECSSGCTSVWQTQGAIYNPVANSWTAVSPPSGWTHIGDAMGLVLSSGTFMLTNCCTGQAAFFNSSTLGWTASTGTQIDNYNDEEGWVLLPDGTVLNIEIWAADKKATSRYTPGSDSWGSPADTVAVLPDNQLHSDSLPASVSYELGPGLLRPDGTVFWIGTAPEPSSTGHTGVYSTSTHTWSAGPDIPNHAGGNDAPAAVLPDGNVLMQVAPAASVSNAFGTPSTFYEFDGSTITAVNWPVTCGGSCAFASYIGGMIVLPSGQVLWTHQSSEVEIYTPLGSASAGWLPVVTSVPGTLAPGSTYTATGTQFNGLGAGAAYGDDMQSATNYPLVAIKNTATGHIIFAKTHNYSTMGVATGGTSVTTQFDVPAGTELGASTFYVIANGIKSAGTSVTVGTLTPHTLTVLVLGQGNVFSPGDPNINCNYSGGAVCSGSGTDPVSMAATPVSGWTFAGWSGGGCSGTGSCFTNTLSAGDITVQARFTKAGVNGGPSDMNGDGYPDLVWRNYQTGANQLWLMGPGGLLSAINLFSTPDTSWLLVGTGDTNGDGLPDLIWRNTLTGGVVVVLMSGPTVIGEAALPTVVEPAWQIAATADMDRDGTIDLIWRNGQTGADVVWYLHNGAYASQANLPSVADPAWQLAAAGDLNGDGAPDLVWRNRQTGQDVVWYMNNTTQLGQAGLATVSDRTWQLVGTADANQDGYADLLWRNAVSGQDLIWLQNGAATIGSVNLLTVTPLAWRIPGTPPVILSDFDNDTWSDLVWRNYTTGQNQVWLMNGATFSSAVNLQIVTDVNWQIAATTDLDGDSHPDLIWRNTATGANLVQYMSGGTILSQAFLQAVPDVNWQLVGAADFDRDGHPDLLWRHAGTGQNAYWAMANPAAPVYVALPSVPDLTWQLVGTADFDGDGYPDLLWRNTTTGANVIWYMHNATLLGQASLPTVADLTWKLVGALDINRDGYPDLLWRNQTSGQDVVWYMNNATLLSQASLLTVADTHWRMGR